MTTKHENLAAALAAVQGNLPHIGKGNTAKVTSEKANYSYKYADLSDISNAVLPVLSEHGLSFSSKPTLDSDGRFVLAYVLRHESGEKDEGAYPLPTSGAPQAIGSAISYARRYCLSAVVGVAPDEDDDGKSAESTTYNRPPQRRAQQQAEQPASEPPVGRGEQPRNGARANGLARPAQAQPAEQSGPPKNAAEARAQLRATCTENGWDLNRVASRFESDHDEVLAKCTDRDLIVRFRASLFSVSDSELRGAPAEAGTR